MTDEELSQDLSLKLTSVLYDENPPEDGTAFERCLFAIELELIGMNKLSSRWVNQVEIDFTSDGQVVATVETSVGRPRQWSSKGVSTFLASIAHALQFAGILIYKIKLRYDQMPELVLGEHPQKRQTCCDLKQYPKSVDFNEAMRQAVASTALV